MEQDKKHGEDSRYSFSRSYIKGLFTLFAGLFLVLYVLGYWQHLMTIVMVFTGIALMIIGAHRMGIFEMISQHVYAKSKEDKK